MARVENYYSNSLEDTADVYDVSTALKMLKEWEEKDEVGG